MSKWGPMESAPRGSGEDGPEMTTHPDYVAPPRLLLMADGEQAVGYYDWYFHPGYGAGASPDEPAWRDRNGEPLFNVTAWRNLPAPPTTDPEAK